MDTKQKRILIQQKLLKHPNCPFCDVLMVMIEPLKQREYYPDNMPIMAKDRQTNKNIICCLKCHNEHETEYQSTIDRSQTGITYSSALPIKDKTNDEINLALVIYRNKVKDILEKYNVSKEDKDHIAKLYSNIYAAKLYQVTGDFIFKRKE